MGNGRASARDGSIALEFEDGLVRGIDETRFTDRGSRDLDLDGRRRLDPLEPKWPAASVVVSVDRVTTRALDIWRFGPASRTRPSIWKPGKTKWYQLMPTTSATAIGSGAMRASAPSTGTMARSSMRGARRR